MWILFKIFVAFVIFTFRVINRFDRSLSFSDGNVNGVEFFRRVIRNKGGVVIESRIGVKTKVQTIFKITTESSFDRFLKAFGFTGELQTGDQSFDQKYYIACDSESIRRRIESSEHIRDIISKLMSGKAQSISARGDMIWVTYLNDIPDESTAVGLSSQLSDEISQLNSADKNDNSDKFIVKILIVEGFVWSIAAYSVMGFYELVFYEQDLFLDKHQLLVTGGLFSLSLIVIGISFIFLFLRKSSRAFRVVVESIIVLLISIPFAGGLIAKDINIHLDSSSPVRVQSTVQGKDKRTHRSRKGGTSYSYHVNLNQIDQFDFVSLPSWIRIESSLFSRLKEGDRLEIEIGRGALGLNWYKKISKLKSTF